MKSNLLQKAGPLLFAGAILEVIFIALWRLADWSNHIPVFLALFFTAFSVYGFVLFWSNKHNLEDVPHLSMILISFAVLFRLTIFWCQPSLSEDFYRYVWDGRVQIAGINPYRYPPEAKELAALRDSNHALINHQDVRTPYPPFAETIFHLLAKIPGGAVSFKAGILLFDFLLIAVLYVILRVEKLPRTLLLVYAWHPLPVLEFSGSGHMDIIAISLFFLSYLMVLRSQNAAGGVLMSAAILTKYIPIISLPWILPKANWKFVMILIVFAVIAIGIYYTPDLVMLKGIFAFYQKWWFNDSLFSILYKLLGGAEPARLFGGGAILLSAAYCLLKRYSIFQSFLIIYGTILIFSPVVHPWYVCWMIPVLVFHRNIAWLFFSGWIVWAYLIIYLFPVGVWQHVLWLTLLVYVPLFLLLFYSAVRPSAQPASAL